MTNRRGRGTSYEAGGGAPPLMTSARLNVVVSGYGSVRRAWYVVPTRMANSHRPDVSFWARDARGSCRPASRGTAAGMPRCEAGLEVVSLVGVPHGSRFETTSTPG